MNEGSWQPDPTHRHELRWWDGQAWTDHVSDQGITSIDPPTYVATEPTAAPPSSWGAPAPVVGTGYGTTPISSTPFPSAANDDTVHRATSIQPPPVATAASESSVPLFSNEPTTPAKKRPMGLIAAAVAGVLAVGVLAFLVFGGGDDESTEGGDTTEVSSNTGVTGSTDGVSTTDPTTTMETTTTVETASAELLLASLPTLSEVPPGWTLADEAIVDPPEVEGPGVGLCGGENIVSVALVFSSDAQVHGPTFAIAGGGTLTIDAYNFPNAELASSFLSATGGIINECAAPVVYQKPESELDFLAAGTAENAVWNLSETGSAGFGETTTVDERLGTVIDTAASTTADTGVPFSLISTELSRYERSGNVVVVYTLRGEHTYSGGDPATAFLPTVDDISARVDEVRLTILVKLEENGFL